MQGFGIPFLTVKGRINVTLLIDPFLFFSHFICYVCERVCVGGYVHTMAHVCRSEDNLHVSILSFHHVVTRGQTQAITLSSKHLYMLSHLSGPQMTLCNDPEYSLENLAKWIFSDVCTPLNKAPAKLQLNKSQ